MNLKSCGLYSCILSSICAASNEQADGCAFCRVMNGINAPKVVECYDSDGKTYRQLAKSGNDDLRQDAVRISVFFLLFLYYPLSSVIKFFSSTSILDGAKDFKFLVSD